MARNAFCVGIDAYGVSGKGDPDGGLFDLRGSVNDALAWADLLARDFRFGSVDLLLDEAATKERVLGGFRELVTGTDKDDVAVFVFSGHGSYAVDTSGSDDETYDEAIVAHDDLIADDELAALLDELHPEARLTSIMDSCFAAGMLDVEREDEAPEPEPDSKSLRPKSLRPKSLRPKSLRPKFLEPTLTGRQAGRPATRSPARIHSTARGLLLAACGPDRVAFDDDFDGIAHGVMTHYALQVIRDARYDLTYEELGERVDELIPQRAFHHQTPLLEGPEAMQARTIFS